MKTLPGGCECGQIRYETAEPMAVWLCHCTDCQRLTSSAFSYNMVVPRALFKTVKGEASSFELDKEREVVCRFCGNCGTWLYTETPLAQEVYMIRVGTLDDHRDMKPVCQVWTQEALPWAVVPGILTVDRDPTQEQMMESMRLWKESHG